MSDDCVKNYELEEVKDHIYDILDSIRKLENKVEQLQMENTLLRNDLTIIKNEGCYRFVENPVHSHKTTCSKCGMVWENTMGYVCSDVNCPVQLKVT